ncbi:MAG: hypothetical protein M1818_005328 [Claussenomyces sp. TS43310]|nr:MAG: hypothetical protein M1818_005328 [Claussenomyces sp. TS43310]
MPPRKSDTSKSIAGDEGAGTGAGASTGTPAKESTNSNNKDGVNIEDLNLPKSIVARLAKGALPPSTQIQGNAMLAMQKSATVFVNYLATHANEHAQSSNRKTVAPGDVFKALDDLELEGFSERLEAELAKFNELQAEKRNSHRKKIGADKASGAKVGSPTDRTGVAGDGLNGEPVAKKARTEPGQTGDDPGEEAAEDDTIGDAGDDIGDEAEEDQDDDEAEDDEEGAGDSDEPPEDRDDADGREVEDEALDNGEDSD